MERCLASVNELLDEIIIVDTGSTDETKTIAKRFTDKVYDFKWIDDFSAARNFSLSFASCDYIMWLDADDIIKNEDKELFLELKKKLWLSENIGTESAPSEEFKDIGTVFAKYNVAFDVNGAPCFSYFRERLLMRRLGPSFEAPIHETMAPVGRIYYADFCVTHAKLKENPKGRNLKIFESMLKKGSQLSPRSQYYYARELMYNGRTKKAVNIFRKFLASEDGFLEDKICACCDIASCYKRLIAAEKQIIERLTTEKAERAFETALDGDIRKRRLNVKRYEKNLITHLLRGLSLDVPRAKLCCLLGEYFLEMNPSQSVFWYKTALYNNEKEKNNLGFVERDYFDFIPAIQLCVAYWRLGDVKNAVFYNEKAGAIKPWHSSYINNKRFFGQR